jgi:hypothetical protein
MFRFIAYWKPIYKKITCLLPTNLEALQERFWPISN